MITLLASLLLWYGQGCWEDQAGNYILFNQTTKTNCQMVDHSVKASGGVRDMLWITRHALGLPMPPVIPAPPPEDPNA